MSQDQNYGLSAGATPEQLLYADILQKGCILGLLMLVCTYLLYVFGVLAPHVPHELVASSWHLGVDEYLKVTDSPHGWNWVALLGTGDFLNFAGLALLAVLTIVCYAVLIPGYRRSGDTVYALIAIAEIVILAFAASGLVGGGGH